MLQADTGRLAATADTRKTRLADKTPRCDRLNHSQGDRAQFIRAYPNRDDPPWGAAEVPCLLRNQALIFFFFNGNKLNFPPQFTLILATVKCSADFLSFYSLPLSKCRLSVDVGQRLCISHPNGHLAVMPISVAFWAWSLKSGANSSFFIAFLLRLVTLDDSFSSVGSLVLTSRFHSVFPAFCSVCWSFSERFTMEILCVYLTL